MKRQFIKADEVSDIKDYRERYFARKKRAREKKAAAANDLKAKVEAAIRDNNTTNNKLEALFELLVPSSGAASTKGGELVRAIMKIMYRDWNDGDLFYNGYGVETCGSAVEFLCDQLPYLYNDFASIAEHEEEEEQYTDSIESIGASIVNEIESDVDHWLEKSDKEMFDYGGEDWIEDQGWIPTYDFECDYPDNVQYHLDADHISAADIEYDLENWDYFRDYDVRADRYGITIYGMKKDDYDEAESYAYSWLERWGDELDEEYGSEEDEAEQEYDEDEEE